MEDFKSLFGFDITPYLSTVKFESGESIIKEGQAAPYLYYLVDGRAKFHLTEENGRISMIRFFTAPSFIGEMELLFDDGRVNAVTALTNCTFYSIDLRKAKSLLLSDPVFLRNLCIYMGRKRQEDTNSFSKTAAYPLENRLAAFILMSETNGYYRMPHTEASGYLSVTYRHLLYVIKDFVAKGIITKTPQGYRIDDYETLENLTP